MWHDRFINRLDAYSVQAVRGDGCCYFPRYEPLTPELFRQHIAGDITLALPAVDGQGTSRWACFDSDQAGGSLNRIQDWLTRNGWHCLREGAREGRDGHLWMFFQEPLQAAALRLFGRRVIEVAGAKPDVIEFFPKSDTAAWDEEKHRIKVCSVVRLPLGVHRKPGANGERGWFADCVRDLDWQTIWLDCQPLSPVAPILKAAPELKRIAEAKSMTHSSRSTFRLDIGLTQSDLVRIQRALGCIPPDDYSVWTRVGMALKSAGADLAMWERWSKESPKYKEGDCARKWNTFHDNRVGLGTLFHIAQRNGFS